MTLRNLASLLVLAAPSVAPHAAGATLVRDLGQGLAYYRVHALPADLPSPASGRPGACVLDLRWAKADEAAADTLRAWVRLNVSVHTPIFVLENSGTAPALVSALAGSGPPGLLVLAPAGATLTPDISVVVAPGNDRSAYEALEKGAAVDTLLADYPDKPRVDEAYLEKEHIMDGDAPDPATDKPQPPLPLVDLVLQRAVQIERGLLILRKTGP